MALTHVLLVRITGLAYLDVNQPYIDQTLTCFAYWNVDLGIKLAATLIKGIDCTGQNWVVLGIYVIYILNRK